MKTTINFPDAEDARRWAALGLGQYADFIAHRGGEAVSQSASSCTRRIAPDAKFPDQTYFLKVYRHARRHHRFAWRRDKASVEAANYRFLRDVCRVDVPEVVCYGSRRRAWALCDAFIITRGVPGAMPLDAFVANRWPDPNAAGRDALRRRLLERTADMVRRMHVAGFYHVDLQWRNLLVAPAPDGDWRVYVIDSSRGKVQGLRLFREHGRLRDLSSLAKEAMVRLTRTERLRWLHRYLGTGRFSMEHRALFRTIERDRVLKDNSRRR